ncbi:MAG TPA: hypothetical protein VEG61_05995 [Candidatus Dormibacteraeota bacterium]|jgi:hypothetical protein|nr:hypothetical protein [Candidatus Dormibacteraeota bacterium]
MITVTAEQVMKILELTDSFNLHREAVVIPLGTEDEGSLMALPDQRLRITVPRNKPFDEWLLELRGKLAKLDLLTIRR